MNRNDSSFESQTNWDEFDAMDDSEIDFSDMPELADQQLSQMKPTRQFFAERGANYVPSAAKSIMVTYDDGTTTELKLAPEGKLVLLDADVIEYFSTSEAVNQALRGLIELIPQRS